MPAGETDRGNMNRQHDKRLLVVYLLSVTKFLRSQSVCIKLRRYNSMPSASAACRSETQAYRNCLQDSRNSGGGGTKKCQSVAVTLENCRKRWRKVNDIKTVEFDGTRVLPNHKCRPLNAKVQHCLKWKQGDESQCGDEIHALNVCMATESGVVAAPTEGDKVWSDYKGRQKR
jgi:hypothetical protein